MRALITPLLLSSIVLVGCSKKKEEGASPAPSNPSPTAPSDKPGDPSAKAAEPATPKRMYTLMSCEKILVPAIKDKYFAGLTPKDDTNETNSGACDFEGPGGSLSYAVACLDAAPAGTYQYMADGAKKRTTGDFKSIEGVGKHAMYGRVGNLNEDGGNYSVTIFDDDSECQISAILPGKVDIGTFAKDAVAAVPIK